MSRSGAGGALAKVFPPALVVRWWRPPNIFSLALARPDRPSAHATAAELFCCVDLGGAN
jgi:hypothetical protein